MKILLICNSLEDGKDGVGDYSKRIAMACRARGILVVLFAFNDRYISDTKSGYVGEIAYSRVPATWPLEKRAAALKAMILLNTPLDWVSLQFVCYGLNDRGIVRANIPVFENILGGLKVYVMMHELWVAEERGTSLKMKLFGLLQKRYILKFLKAIRPRIIHTSMPLYKKMLERAGVKTSILPLFSNIEYNDTIEARFNDIIPRILNNRDNYIVGCVFGSIYNESWDMRELLVALEKAGQEQGKGVVIASIGKLGNGEEFWEALPAKFKNIEFLTLGQQSEQFISYWLTHCVNLGIITTPVIIAGKSGSYMAFLEHGLPIFAKKNTLKFNFEIADDMIDKRIIQVDKHFKLNVLQYTKPVSQIEKTVETFIQTLNTNQ